MLGVGYGVLIMLFGALWQSGSTPEIPENSDTSEKLSFKSEVSSCVSQGLFNGSLMGVLSLWALNLSLLASFLFLDLLFIASFECPMEIEWDGPLEEEQNRHMPSWL